MAKVEWSAGIDSVSGALSKPGKNGQHSCNKMLLGTHRTAPTESDKCNRLYLRKKTKRTSVLSQDEITARIRFSAVAAAVATRSKDLTKIAADRQAFLEQKDTAGGRKTMKGYLWKVEGQAYDAQHSQG